MQCSGSNELTDKAEAPLPQPCYKSNCCESVTMNVCENVLKRERESDTVRKNKKPRAGEKGKRWRETKRERGGDLI